MCLVESVRKSSWLQDGERSVQGLARQGIHKVLVRRVDVGEVKLQPTKHSGFPCKTCEVWVDYVNVIQRMC